MTGTVLIIAACLGNAVLLGFKLRLMRKIADLETQSREQGTSC
ncbi:hypothetical protein [Ferrovibrio sp.]|nr:hypothetical protein [Ferrovibrio sp.]